MPLGVYLFIACGLIWWWAVSRRQSTASLVLAGVFAGGAALTKEEGVFALVILLAAAPIVAIRVRGDGQLRGARWWRPLAWMGLPCAVVVVPWVALRLGYPVSEGSVHLAGLNVTAVLQRLVIASIGVSIRAVNQWLTALALIAGWLILRWRRSGGVLAPGAGDRLMFLASVILCMMATDVIGIVVNPIEVHAEVSVAASRLLLQVLPLVLLVAAELWPAVLAGDTRGGARQTAEVSSARPGDSRFA